MTDEEWRPSSVLLAVDLVIFTIRDGKLQVLLVERGIEPYCGLMALPGGFLADEREPLLSAARRELREEAGLDDGGIHLEQSGTYSDPDRDPRGRVISIAYLAVAPRLPEPTAGTDARDARWVPVRWVSAGEVRLAFDHERIIAEALEQARTKLEHTALATLFCGETFTISDLQQVYEAVWGLRLDPRNFYRKVQSTPGFIVPSGPMRKTQSGRPARLFRAGPRTVLYPPMVRTAVPPDSGRSTHEPSDGDSHRLEP